MGFALTLIAASLIIAWRAPVAGFCVAATVGFLSCGFLLGDIVNVIHPPPKHLRAYFDVWIAGGILTYALVELARASRRRRAAPQLARAIVRR